MRHLFVACATVLGCLGAFPSARLPSQAPHAHTAVQAPSCAAGVPAPALCDRTLGVAFTMPAGWSRVPAAKLLPGTLELWTLTPGAQEPPLHLAIDLLGVTTACSDAQAARAVADSLSQGRNNPPNIQTFPTTLGGAPAVMIDGLPGSPTFASEIIVAHGGLVYGFLTFGSGGRIGGLPTFTPQQQIALNSLRFIPRSGVLPGPMDSTVTPALRRCVAVRPERLSLADVQGLAPLALFVEGAAFAPSQLVTVRMMWRGVPLRGARPRYTSYTSYATLRATGTGFFMVRLSVPVCAASYASYAARIVAIDSYGRRIVRLDTTFAGTTPTSRPAGTAAATCGRVPA